MTSICLVATYFGRLPSYVNIWLDSCTANPHINFLLVTDQIYREQTPPNVRIISMSLDSLADIFSSHLGSHYRIASPYKICDFRPLFFLLPPAFGIQCDYWGYTDLDVVYGDILNYVTPFVAAGYDRIFGFGHLSIIRNRADCNSLYRSDLNRWRWQDVFAITHNIGFDEHFGVNVAWHKSGLKFYDSFNHVADIDPGVRRIELVAPMDNSLFQVVSYYNGRIQRHRWRYQGIVEDSFCYAHFQKRRMNYGDSGLGNGRTFLAPDGFSHSDTAAVGFRELIKYNNYLFEPNEASYRIRRFLRRFRLTVENSKRVVDVDTAN